MYCLLYFGYMKSFIIFVLVVIILGGGWYIYREHTASQTEDAMVQGGDTMEQDIGEGRDIDIAAAVRANIVGGWQSNEDGNFIRSIRGDGIVEDLYDGQEPTLGAWTVFTSKDAPENFTYPLEVDTPYLRIVDDTGLVLDFKVTKLTPETLELIYLDRGGALTFTRSVN